MCPLPPKGDRPHFILFYKHPFRRLLGGSMIWSPPLGNTMTAGRIELLAGPGGWRLLHLQRMYFSS